MAFGYKQQQVACLIVAWRELYLYHVRARDARPQGDTNGRSTI
jgi:hypothetical protein